LARLKSRRFDNEYLSEFWHRIIENYLPLALGKCAGRISRPPKSEEEIEGYVNYLEQFA
jgi:hypothetical protein